MFYPHGLHNESDAHCQCLNSSHIAWRAEKGTGFLVKGITIKHFIYTWSDCVLTQQFVITYLINIWM